MNRKDNTYFYSVQILFYLQYRIYDPETLGGSKHWTSLQFIKHAKHIGILGYPYKQKKGKTKLPSLTITFPVLQP